MRCQGLTPPGSGAGPGTQRAALRPERVDEVDMARAFIFFIDHHKNVEQISTTNCNKAGFSNSRGGNVKLHRLKTGTIKSIIVD